MSKKILIINGPNLNLLGEREQSQYGTITLDKIKENCLKKTQELGLVLDFKQSNIEGEVIELHISNIYKREEFRHKSLISGVVKGGIYGFGDNGYILAINAIHELIKNGNR